MYAVSHEPPDIENLLLLNPKVQPYANAVPSAVTKKVRKAILTSSIKFPIYVIYSNTLVHSSPHLPVYCMGRWVRLHCFFTNGNIKYDTTFYA